jgi:hypothetical protein
MLGQRLQGDPCSLQEVPRGSLSQKFIAPLGASLEATHHVGLGAYGLPSGAPVSAIQGSFLPSEETPGASPPTAAVADWGSQSSPPGHGPHLPLIRP